MAHKLGISQPTLARLESAEQNITIDTLTRLCRALDCDPGDLFRPGSLRLAAARTAPRQPFARRSQPT
jgi:transcriptional regulator with XRE-family HTH domain